MATKRKTAAGAAAPRQSPPPPSAAMRAIVDKAVRTKAQRTMAAQPVVQKHPSRTRVPPVACSMSGVPDAKRDASNRIAHDIAAFKAGGGRIERLGVTRVFHHPASNDDE